MKNLTLVLLLLPLCILAQEQYVYKNQQDSSYNSYLKLLPFGEIKGMIVRDYSNLPDLTKGKSPYQFTQLALDAGFLVLYVNTTNVFPELYFENKDMLTLDAIIAEVLQDHNVPNQNIFIGGISASGTRALRYTAFCEKGKSPNDIEIAGVFAVDSPLDLERFYLSSKHVLQRNAPNGMLWEASLMTDLLEKSFGGSPEDKPTSYHSCSVYSYSLPDGGNAQDYLNVPIIIYHEPDLNWWIEERSATLLDLNSFDIMGFVSQLRIDGHTDVTLIETSGKGFDRKGNRKPHSWTIVDESALVQWILDRCTF